MYDEQGRYGRGGRGGGGGGDRDRGGPRERRSIPLSELDPALTEVSRKVIGCAIEVHKAIGPGFGEAIYAKALQNELGREGVKFDADYGVPVMFRDEEVGRHKADLMINDRFIVEVMAEHKEIGGLERAALRAMLRAADMELGLIINFGERRLKDGLVRVLNPDKLNELRGEDAQGQAEGGHDHSDDDADDDGYGGDDDA